MKISIRGGMSSGELRILATGDPTLLQELRKRIVQTASTLNNTPTEQRRVMKASKPCGCKDGDAQL